MDFENLAKLPECGTLHFENQKCAGTRAPTVWRCGR